MASLISAIHWVPRGRAAQYPQRTNLNSEEEVARISALTGLHFQDAQKQLEEAQKAAQGMGKADEEWEDEEGSDGDDDEKMSDDAGEQGKVKNQGDGEGDAAMDEDLDGLSRFKLDDYDKEESGGTLGAFSNIKGLTFHRNNDEDPYITMKDDDADSQDSREALEVYPTDNLIIAAKTEDDISQIDAYLYSSSDSNIYVHHDLMLPSFPLCLEWLDYRPAAFTSSADQNDAPVQMEGAAGAKAGDVGNFIAVGTMDPEIEIWSMDVVEACFPDAILGRKDLTEGLNAPLGTGKKKKRQMRARVPNPTHHVDAVLGLSWNRTARNILASASADTTVKLWDLSRPCSGEHGSALRSFDKVHTDKVQSVQWNTSGSSSGAGAGSAATVLLTGSFDGTLRVFDSRSPEAGVFAKVDSDVECVKWHPWKENHFLASLESGLLQSFDARMLSNGSAHSAQSSTALWTLSAHTGACTSFDVNTLIPGCIVTAGSDRQTKVWSLTDGVAEDIGDARPANISLVANRDLDAGKIFSVAFSPDEAMTVAVAGSKGVLRVWDAFANVGVRKTFGDRLKALSKDKIPALDGPEPSRGDGVVKLADEDDEEEEEDEDVA
ncbi:WD40 repeat-like protein [Tilletiaria anomala UBC 951]|uniref:WD40 repeat-like protein n=1 Tax=Tilletiaria anomala (strain ATCC 24038 / CBS 436.72 / UBC 951) TaxID=1037660 RepID=A0A066VQU7_TILAU|nr:WD40 repeat-like protein [Tilletiaria anomala UBC 951]KDN44122.1 WD40 repeat-like protein [Tilletiaria anomala UBC 951]